MTTQQVENTVSPDLYKNIMGQFPTGVTVITAYNDLGDVVGFTASAFSALSIDPALVLVCPSYTSDSYPVIRDTKKFAIHILADDQQAVAYQFAKKGIDKSEGLVIHKSEHGVPVIEGALAVLECELWNDYPGGDHAILVGQVVDAQLANTDEQHPLLYCRSKMGSLPKLG
ncbi:flavin reductase family protein [Vibrio japonicus]|uniref:Flavin reductase family protein n=1 Tax=Vibrio japonicus TaxID=1824638 RepID=A0ABY5LFQ5_9VIBR|nr:flavin reductase family protein [Vibrio japonicus]UUM29673.1 flavin reductase family protein [Vibrio japonicus]